VGMGPVESATRSDLKAMGSEAEGSALGASAVDLARRQDEAHLPNQAAQCAKELRETLRVLTERFPPAPEVDEVDELRARRERGA
jgi:hypothetical protein